MSQFSSIFKNEAIANRGWFIGWFLGMGITFISISLMYPGEEGMASFLKLLEDPNFQAFFGNISESNDARRWRVNLDDFSISLET